MLTWYRIERINESSSEMTLPVKRWVRDDRVVTCPKPPDGHSLWQVKDERGGGYRWWILALGAEFEPQSGQQDLPTGGFELHYFGLRAQWCARVEKPK
jgi:hypothetical protein